MASELAEFVAPWIAERSQARATEWRRRKEAKTRERADRKAARTAGLVARHAAKLARRQPGMLI